MSSHSVVGSGQTTPVHTGCNKTWADLCLSRGYSCDTTRNYHDAAETPYKWGKVGLQR